MVIEAKVLGCKLHLNENVQHAKEIWFETEDMLDTESYLFAARSRFWNALQATMSWTPKISGYTTTRNCISQKYPYEEAIQSMLDFSDEVVVVDGGSDDGTWERLESWSKEEERLKRALDQVEIVVHAAALKQVVAAEVIVIPLSCSCSIQSIVAAPS